MTNFKTFRILNGCSDCAKTWHTFSTCPGASPHRISSSSYTPVGSSDRANIISAIREFSVQSAHSRPTTSNSDISACSDRSEPSFGHVVPPVVVSLCFEFEVNRPRRSAAVRRGFEPCRVSRTEYSTPTSVSYCSAHSAARKLKFGEDVPVLFLCTLSKAHQDLRSRFRITA